MQKLSDNSGGKIIGVGMQKTGTSSLRDALRMLGYSVGDNNYQQLFPILHGHWKQVWRKLQKYDAVEDNPWPMIYKEIDVAIPYCKFILTLRNEDSWFESVSRHIGHLRDPMHEWVYGRNKGVPANDKANAINVFRQHNREVQEYFKDRPGDLLVIDFAKGEGWDKLCDFLGKPVPDIPFPHANDATKPRNFHHPAYWFFKYYKKQLKYWLQIHYYRSRGFI